MSPKPERTRRGRAERLAEGLCARCGSTPHREGYTTCARCAERANQVQMAWQKKRHRERVEAGRCTRCPNPPAPAAPGRLTCERCAAAVRESVARTRAERPRKTDRRRKPRPEAETPTPGNTAVSASRA